MRGKYYLSFIPFHLSALEREPKLVDWIKTLTKSKQHDTTSLSPGDWYEQGHDIAGWSKRSNHHSVPIIETGTFIWSPPPAACDVALEELRKARIKRQDSTYFIIVVPRLMTPMWLKQMYKCCDLIVEIPPSCEYWPSNMYKPCVVGNCFPYLSHSPWRLRSTLKLFQLRRELQKVWKEDQFSPGIILRKFLVHSTCRHFPTMPVLSFGFTLIPIIHI